MNFKTTVSLVLLIGALSIAPAAMAESKSNQEQPQNLKENTTQPSNAISPISDASPPTAQEHSAALASLQKFKDTFDYSLQKPVTPTHDFAGHVWLISYADGDDVHYANQNYLTQTAVNKGFDFIMMYRKSNIDHDFYEANRKILEQPRGAGYWLWKPYFILKTMNTAPENDIVVYIDAGVSINTNIMPLLEHTKTADIALVENLGSNRGQIKRDAVLLSGMDDSVLDKRNLEAGVVIVKNTPNARGFIKQWLLMCQNPRSLTDQPSEAQEYPDFSHHLHDQSLLGLLYLQNISGVNLISDDEKTRHFSHHRRRPERYNFSLFEYHDD